MKLSIRAALVSFIALGLVATAAGVDEKKDDKKKPEPFSVKKLTQGMGLYAIGPVSPDGRSIILLAQKPDSAPNLYVMNLTDFSIRRPLTSFKWGVSDPAWSPDGKAVAFAAANESSTFTEIFVLDVESGKQRQLTKNGFTDKEPVFTPDGKRLLFTSDESPLPDAAFGILHVAAVNVAGGKPDFFTHDEVSSIRPGISTGGQGVLLLKIDEQSGRHSLWQYGFNGKPERDLTGRKFARIHRLVVSQPSQAIVLWAQEEAEQQDGIYILDLKSGDVRELPEPDLPKHTPAVSPDGKLVAFIGPTETGNHLFVFDSTTGLIRQLTFKGVNNHSPAFASNNQVLFGSDRDKANEIYLLDLAAPGVEDKKKK